MAIPNNNNNVIVSNFRISNDGLTIDVTVETESGYIISGAKFWTDKTFQNETLGIDISSYLTGVNNIEVFSIRAEDVGVSNFYDGIFFTRFVTNAPAVSNCDSCNTPLGVAISLISAKLCLMEKVLSLDVCSQCNDGCSCIDKCEVVVLDKYIKALSYALEFGVYAEAIDLLNGIRKLCTTCSECIDPDTLTYSTGLGYYTLNNSLILR